MLNGFLFLCQVSRLQVAELVAAAVANPELAENKVSPMQIRPEPKEQLLTAVQVPLIWRLQAAALTGPPASMPHAHVEPRLCLVAINSKCDPIQIKTIHLRPRTLCLISQ